MGSGHHRWQKASPSHLIPDKAKIGFVLLLKVDGTTADLLSCPVIGLLQPFGEHMHTITGDNGKEFAEHELISHELNTDFFFAHPFAAWVRGTNENTNGFVRQYIPKHRQFDTITEHELLSITNPLNHRPR